MISSPSQQHEGHAVVVVDLDEPLEVPLRDVRVRAEVAQVAGAVGQPAVERDDVVGVGGRDRAQVDRRAVGGDDVGLPVRRVGRVGTARTSAVVGVGVGRPRSPRSRHVSPGGPPGRGRAAGRRRGGSRARRWVDLDLGEPRRRSKSVRVASVGHRRRQLPVGVGSAAYDVQPAGIGASPVDVAVEHGGEQVRPRPRHHPEQPVPAAARGEPAPARSARAASSRSLR